MCVRWEEKARRKEPYSIDMFLWLRKCLSVSSSLAPSFLEVLNVVYDWQRLGIFTGSRVSEYAQAKVPKGQRFNVVPQSTEAGRWAGFPIAFMRCDFTFYDAAQTMVPHSNLFDAHSHKLVNFVEICFRFDKSSTNFSCRKYSCTKHDIFCPVDAAVSILHRADILGVPDSEPVGVVISKSRSVSHSFRFLRDADITKVMRQACVGAHAPDHYLRQRINCIVPHSNRVTAAVCLQQGGAHNDEIAFQLRWHPTSVPIYLRHCFKAVGPVLQKVVSGVLLAH